MFKSINDLNPHGISVSAILGALSGPALDRSGTVLNKLPVPMGKAWKTAESTIEPAEIEAAGLTTSGTVRYNFSAAPLVEEAIRRGEAQAHRARGACRRDRKAHRPFA